MGYHSQVGIKCEEKAFGLLKEACKKVELVPNKVLKDGDYYILYWDWTKWYSMYEDIAEIEGVLDTLDEMHSNLDTGYDGYGYKFIRLGEDESDTEFRDNGSDIEFYTSRYIVLPEVEEFVE